MRYQSRRERSSIRKSVQASQSNSRHTACSRPSHTDPNSPSFPGRLTACTACAEQGPLSQKQTHRLLLTTVCRTPETSARVDLSADRSKGQARARKNRQSLPFTCQTACNSDATEGVIEYTEVDDVRRRRDRPSEAELFSFVASSSVECACDADPRGLKLGQASLDGLHPRLMAMDQERSLNCARLWAWVPCWGEGSSNAVQYGTTCTGWPSGMYCRDESRL